MTAWNDLDLSEFKNGDEVIITAKATLQDWTLPNGDWHLMTANGFDYISVEKVPFKVKEGKIYAADSYEGSVRLFKGNDDGSLTCISSPYKTEGDIYHVVWFAPTENLREVDTSKL